MAIAGVGAIDDRAAPQRREGATLKTRSSLLRGGKANATMFLYEWTF
jgi:hypothetical protein